MVVNVEQGDVNPSVGTLLRLSDALGIGLPALVEPPQDTLVKVTRRGEGATLWSGEGGGRGVLVAGTAPPDVIELWDWSLAPGELHTSEAHAPGTTGLLHVLQDSILVEVADEPVTMRVGDALTFGGDVAHSYANAGSGTARFALAVFEPGVGSGGGGGSLCWEASWPAPVSTTRCSRCGPTTAHCSSPSTDSFPHRATRTVKRCW